MNDEEILKSMLGTYDPEKDLYNFGELMNNMEGKEKEELLERILVLYSDNAEVFSQPPEVK